MGAHLGQHFLASEGYRKRILDALRLTGRETVLEIGPGRGELTALIAERAGRLIAVEIDPVLAARLREQFVENPRVEIVQADILRVPLDAWPAPVRAFGNLPYYITSPISERADRRGPGIQWHTKNVGLNDLHARVFHELFSQSRGQHRIDLDGDEPAGSFRNQCRQFAAPRADFENRLAAGQAQGVENPLSISFRSEKMLSEMRAHSFSLALLQGNVAVLFARH